MKRILSLILAVLMVLSLVACGGKKKENKKPWEGLKGLYVGYGKAAYTPDLGTPMGGYGASLNRLSTGQLSDLYLLCLAITDGEDVFLLYAMDACTMADVWVARARERVSKATGVPESQIIICSTHTHSAPDLGITPESEPSMKDAYDKSLAAAEKAAKAALKDLAPATVYGATAQTEGLAFVRHFVLSDGSIAGDNFGNWNAGLVTGYAMENDPQMVLAKFERKGAKDILLMNFQVHPCMESGNDITTFSADVVGRVRDYMTEQTDMNVIYFTGSAGNQNTVTKLLKDAHAMDSYAYAEKLGNYALSALETMTPLTGDSVSATHYDYTGDVWQNDDPIKLEQAKEVSALFNQEGRDVATVLAREYGFASVYEANAVITHSSMEPTRTMEMKAFNIGGLGLVTAPYEMFSKQGTYIKTNSPFEFTVVCSMAGPHNGYIPSVEAYDYGCYESQTCYFVRGTAEIVAEKYVDLLTEVK